MDQVRMRTKLRRRVFGKLQEICNSGKGKLIIAGDFNTRVGKEAEALERVIENNGDDKFNNNGKQLLECYLVNDFIVTNKHFQHKGIHKFTKKVVSRGQKSIVDYL